MSTMMDPKTNLLAASYVCKYVKSGEDGAPPCNLEDDSSGSLSETGPQSDAAAPTTNPNGQQNENIYSNGTVVVSKQVRFLLLIRILFKLITDDERRHARQLARTNASPQEGPKTESLKVQVSKVIKHCIEQNRKGIPEYSPLGKVIQHRLQHVPNIERYWNQAEHDLILYLAGCRARKQKQLQQQQRKEKDEISVVGV